MDVVDEFNKLAKPCKCGRLPEITIDIIVKEEVCNVHIGCNHCHISTIVNSLNPEIMAKAWGNKIDSVSEKKKFKISHPTPTTQRWYGVWVKHEYVGKCTCDNVPAMMPDYDSPFFKLRWYTNSTDQERKYNAYVEDGFKEL